MCLAQDHHRLFRHATPRRVDVRLENVLKRKPLVLEQAIRRRRLGAPAACRRDARGRLPCQLREHDGQPFVQTLVGKVCGLHFLTRPGSQHDGTPLPESAPLRQFWILRLSPIRGNPPRSMRTCVEQQAVNGRDRLILEGTHEPELKLGPNTAYGGNAHEWAYKYQPFCKVQLAPHAQRAGISRRLGRQPSTISRELRRNRRDEKVRKRKKREENGKKCGPTLPSSPAGCECRAAACR